MEIGVRFKMFSNKIEESELKSRSNAEENESFIACKIL